jgi:hypothetical protein
MAAELLVESRIDDGKRLIDQLVRDGFGVTAAFWVKADEDGPWHLYVASPRVVPEKPGEAYAPLYASLSKIPDLQIHLSEIKLIDDANPIARDAVAVSNLYPRRRLTRYRGKRLGDLSIEEAYIYPTTISPRQSKKVTIYGLFYKGEPTGALHLSLEPHNPNSRLIVESMGQQHEYPADTSRTWVVSVPEGSVLERDDIGRLVLAWDLPRHRTQSSANEVLSLARLGLHGFRLVPEPAKSATPDV